jgi:hypothetical protein
MLGQGNIYDEYPYGFADKRNFYERTIRGEKIEATKEE